MRCHSRMVCDILFYIENVAAKAVFVLIDKYRHERIPAMATTSYLYHTMGLIGYQHLKTEFHGGDVYFHITKKQHERRCAGCRARWHDLTMQGRFTRTFRALPIGRRKQFVVLHGHEQGCNRCGKVLREPIPFAEGKRRRLKAFDRYVVDLCRIAPIKHVALFLSAGWDLVKEVFKEHLKKRLKKRKLTKVRYSAIDEFSVRKGHQYMTVVLDLETGEVLYANEGKDAGAIIPFLKQIKRKGAKLAAVAIDMSPAYIQAIGEVFPQVDIVHDPYHVVAMVNKAIDETRRDMARELNQPERQYIKGSRFLLLKGLENLSPHSLERLMKLMEVNQPLYQAYLLKEDLRMFWNLQDEQIGRRFLDTWINEARSLKLTHFVKLADTLERHYKGLLSYFKHRISTGPLEGLNNKIKVLKRQAYGFRDNIYFKLRLYFIHEGTPAFTG
jgi:transposase